jgi:phage terminase small subunit
MPGPPSKPTSLKLLDVNPGRRPIPVDDFRPATQIPECPPHLNGEARKEWDRITTELSRYGMISEVDQIHHRLVFIYWKSVCCRTEFCSDLA